MSKTVRGVTLGEWLSVRKHITTDILFGGNGSYGDGEEFWKEQAKVSFKYVLKMDKAFGVESSKFIEDFEFMMKSNGV